MRTGMGSAGTGAILTGQVEDRAVVLEVAAGGQAADDGDRLVHPLPAAGPVDAEHLVVLAPRAGPDAEDEPAAGEHGRGGGLLGGQHPSHLFALDALLATYPGALVIQTHRAPRVAIASVCSLAAQASDGWSETFRGPVIGKDQLATWASGLERFTAERARHDPARFYDVGYEEFVADPFGTAEAAYGYFGLPLPGAAADAMRSLIGADAAGRGQGHRYTLADFGLTGAEVDERFAVIPGYEPSKR